MRSLFVAEFLIEHFPEGWNLICFCVSNKWHFVIYIFFFYFFALILDSASGNEAYNRRIETQSSAYGFAVARSVLITGALKIVVKDVNVIV